MTDDLKATKFLFDKIKRIYPTFEYPDELDVQIWSDVLEGYSQTDILEALKDYRKNVPYDKAPNPGEFKKYLPEKEKTPPPPPPVDTKPRFTAFAPAEFFMQRDIELKRCRHNLYIYKQAVDYVINELLLEKIPSDVWRRLSFADKVTAAKNNGLFSRLDDVLVLVSKQRLGRAYEFQSEAELNAGKASQASGHTFDEAVAEVANWWHN